MRKLVAILGISSLLFSMAAVANATDIQNGGFETGDLTGWTSAGQTSVTNVGFDPRTNNVLPTVAPGLGSHSAKVGDQNAWGYFGSEKSSITQSWTKSSTFDHLYFAWAAVGLVPNNGVYHSADETPWFQIKIRDITSGGTLFSKEYYTGNLGGITPGWLSGAANNSALGRDDAGIWYYRPWDVFDLNLAGIADGDLLSITLSTRDCTLSGHASYAYLDGFGSTAPPLATPEPGTLALLICGFLGMGLFKRKTRKQ